MECRRSRGLVGGGEDACAPRRLSNVVPRSPFPRRASLGDTWCGHVGAVLARFIGGLFLVVVGLITIVSTAHASTDPLGGYNTTVAISAPSFHGVEPHLSLTYSSSGGNGFAGRGWSISGLSTIRRSSATWGLPRWSGTDTYSLDGLHLVKCDGAPAPYATSPSCKSPSDGGIAFTAERETYSRIVFLPTESGGEWRVIEKNGPTKTYSPGTNDPAGVLDWHLSTVQDRSGNTASYNWAIPGTDTPTRRPQVPIVTQIIYGDIEIRFQSEARPDPWTLATSTGVATNYRRLQAIDVLAAGQRIRAYNLTYEIHGSGSGQSFLSSVQEFGSDATVDTAGVHGPTFHPPVTFEADPLTKGNGAPTWTSGANTDVAGWSTGLQDPINDTNRFTARLNGGSQGKVGIYSTEINPPGIGRQPDTWLSADFDGDSRTDFMHVPRFPVMGWRTVDIELTQPDGGYIIRPIGIPATDASAEPFLADVDGDGTADLILWGQQGATVYTISGGYLGGHATSGPAKFPTTAYPTLSLYGFTPKVVDVTGDGRADLITFSADASCPVWVQVTVNDGRGFFRNTLPRQCWSGATTDPNVAATTLQVTDQNGDGRSDLSLFQTANPEGDRAPKTAHVLTAFGSASGTLVMTSFDTGQGWAATTRHRACENIWTICTYTRSVKVLAGDVDADGRADLIVAHEGSNGRVMTETLLGAGDGTFTPGKSAATNYPNARLESWLVELKSTGDEIKSTPGLTWLALDQNADGAADLIVVGPQKEGPSPDTRVQTIETSLGDGTGSWANTTIAVRDWRGGSDNSQDSALVLLMEPGDVNGDALPDILFVHGSPGALVELDAQPAPFTPSVTRLLRGDVDGDGRDDKLMVAPVRDGIQVRTLVNDSAGHYRVDTTAPIYTSRRLALSGWRTAYLNDDHLVDLVNLDPTSRIVALLNQGSGHTWTTVQSNVSAPAVPVEYVLDTNADGRSDILIPHYGRNEAGHVVIATLLGQNDGTFTWSSDDIADPSLDPVDFTPCDIDADGHTDLVRVDTRTATIKTLLNNGSGWSLVTDRPWGSSPPDLPGLITGGPTSAMWTTTDLNGDGATDLIHLDVDENGKLHAASLLGKGDGRFSPSKGGMPLVPAIGGPIGGADNRNWMGKDLNGDNQQDLVHVRNIAGDLMIQSCLAHDDSAWSCSNSTIRGTQPPRTSQQGWEFVSTDNGTTTLESMSARGDEMSINQIDYHAAPDTIVRTANHRGLVEQVDYANGLKGSPYGPQPAECGGPAGLLATLRVVRSQITTDSVSHTSTQSSTDYHCLRYTQHLHAPTTWGEVRTATPATANRPGLTTREQHTSTEHGLVQTTLTDTRDSGTGQVVARSTSIFSPPGLGAEVDLETTRSTDRCAEQQCATSTTASSYDDFGDITRLTRTAAGSGRSSTTDTTYLRNINAWLNVPSGTVTTATNSLRIPFVPATAATVAVAAPGNAVSATRNCYDADATANCDDSAALSRGLITGVREWDNVADAWVITSRRTYDELGNLTSSTDANSHPTTTTYDPVGHVHAIKTCNALQQCTATPEPWDRRADAPPVIRTPNGNVTRTSFDPLGRPTNVLSPTDVVNSYSYIADDTVGTVVKKVTRGRHDPDQVQIWTRAFTDGLGRPYRAEESGALGESVVANETRYTDSSELPAAKVRARGAGQARHSDTVTYDAGGRVTRVTHSGNTGTATTSYRVSNDGAWIVRNTDETGRWVEHSYDGWNTLTATTDPTAEPGRTATTTYLTDLTGNTVQITDPAGNTVTREWDSRGRLMTEKDKDTGTVAYIYDAQGNVTSKTDALGRTSALTYDALNRPISRHDEPGGIVSTWAYDEPGHGASVGRLTTSSDPSGAKCVGGVSTRQDYDTLGRLAQTTQCTNGVVGTVQTGYDHLNRAASTTYPNGQTIRVSYDGASRPRAIPGILERLDYTPAGQPASATYSNGTTGTWTYDADRAWLASQTLQPSTSTAKKSDTPLFSINLGHAPNGLILTEEGTQGRGTYTYDELGRLTKVEGTQSQTLTYDDLGNIKTNTDINGPYQYDPTRPHAVTHAGPRTLTYNAAGEMVQVVENGAQLRRIEWSNRGKVTRITERGKTITNIYSGGGDRRQQSTPTTGTTTYIGGLAAYNPSSGWTNYVYVDGDVVAQVTKNVTTWLVTDSRNSTRLATDSHGAVVGEARYSALGRRIASASSGVGELGYTGHRSIGDSDLVDMNARVYDPYLGRMISPDSIIPDQSRSQALNRYTYVYNNPISFTDPSGHLPELDPKHLLPGSRYAPPTSLAGEEAQAEARDSVGQVKAPVSDSSGTSTEKTYHPELPWYERLASLMANNPAPRFNQAALDMKLYAQTLVGVASGIHFIEEQLGAPLWAGFPPAGGPEMALEESLPLLEAVAAGKIGLFEAGNMGKAAEVGAIGNAVEAGASAAGRGLNKAGGVVSEAGINAAGGRVFTSTGTITQNDFAHIVNNGLMRGDSVDILTGAHGSPSGAMMPSASMYTDDVARFGGLPGVTVHNVPSMSPETIRGVLQRPGTIIGGFCDSAACLAPYR